MRGTDILTGLNGDQALAAAVSHNAVVAAGAGSGKTKTLASRYAWLVMEKGLKVDEILTLTFTNKAVGEMYERIYRMLEAYKDNQERPRSHRKFSQGTDKHPRFLLRGHCPDSKRAATE